jgi:uncharacterized coiled-coil protein SlyX
MPNPYLSNNREASNPIYTYTAKTIDMQRMKMMWVMSVLSIEEELVWNVYSSWSIARTVAFRSAWKSQVCTLLSTSVYIDFKHITFLIALNLLGVNSVSNLEDSISRLEGEVSKLSDRVGKLEERVGRVEEAVNALRERVARVEGIVEQMDKRLNHIETELREFRREVFTELSSLRRELSTRFYWLIGVQISMWVTIILAILFRVH